MVRLEKRHNDEGTRSRCSRNAESVVGLPAKVGAHDEGNKVGVAGAALPRSAQLLRATSASVRTTLDRRAERAEVDYAVDRAACGLR